MPARFCLEISGDFACFTRPEMKVERVSYDIITPSAVRAIFESILWKPAIRWQPEKIEVLAPIRWTTIRRNEIGSKLSTAQVTSAMQHGTGSLALYVEEERQQRASLLLRDVRYRIIASFTLTGKAGAEENLQKFAGISCGARLRGSASTNRTSVAASLPATFGLSILRKSLPRFLRNCAGHITSAGCSMTWTLPMQHPHGHASIRRT